MSNLNLVLKPIEMLFRSFLDESGKRNDHLRNQNSLDNALTREKERQIEDLKIRIMADEHEDRRESQKLKYIQKYCKLYQELIEASDIRQHNLTKNEVQMKEVILQSFLEITNASVTNAISQLEEIELKLVDGTPAKEMMNKFVERLSNDCVVLINRCAEESINGLQDHMNKRSDSTLDQLFTNIYQKKINSEYVPTSSRRQLNGGNIINRDE